MESSRITSTLAALGRMPIRANFALYNPQIAVASYVKTWALICSNQRGNTRESTHEGHPNLELWGIGYNR